VSSRLLREYVSRVAEFSDQRGACMYRINNAGFTPSRDCMAVDGGVRPCLDSVLLLRWVLSSTSSVCRNSILD
jgi:hypothetical protein